MPRPQIQTSSNWGGVVGNFFTGGLNLQIEHPLFPAIAFVHYPAIARIVRDECKKRGVEYAHYDTLPEILGRYVRYMRDVGTQDVPEGWRRMEDGAWGTRQVTGLAGGLCLAWFECMRNAVGDWRLALNCYVA